MINSRRHVLFGSVLSAFLVAFAHGYVGVDDSCPVPTPYPPEGAGWGVLNNPSFEDGFTNGVANEWIGWQDDTYTGQVHFVGSDRYYPDGGSYSQKLQLPQPPPDTAHQEAGVYQQVYVVAGETYTVTAEFYLYFPQQGSPGNDLLAFLGVDPFGQESGDGYGMVWDEVGSTDTWLTASVTVEAFVPVITVGVKGTRKWPQLGDGAYVWMDALTITGPIPTDPPPGPEPDPVDPETLIPETVGSNLVTNASFEQAFTGGVSSGWNKWWTAGNGTWKRSQLVGKVGGGFYDCGNRNELRYMNPKTLLFLAGNPEFDPEDKGTMGQIEDLINHDTQGKLQDTIFVGRPFIDLSLWDYFNTETPEYWARRLANHCKHFEELFPRVDCWQALNEPGTDDPAVWAEVLEFEFAFADECRPPSIRDS